MKVAIWQVCLHQRQRRTVPPDPYRDPSPEHVDHLCHHARGLVRSPHTQGNQQAITGLYVENQTTGTSSDNDQMEALQTDEQITPITTVKRRRTVGRVRHRPRSLKTAGYKSVQYQGPRPLSATPQPTPGHPHSTWKRRQSGHSTTSTRRHLTWKNVEPPPISSTVIILSDEHLSRAIVCQLPYFVNPQ